ncbi:MAG: hypothetical protein LBJ13_00455, partial [Puniceicoccales bacterium]|nr:hypothetical protein [Puniceicoccales bacterium]
LENSENFTENEIQKYQNVGMPQEVAEALDKLKFSGWNCKDQKNLRGRSSGSQPTMAANWNAANK